MSDKPSICSCCDASAYETDICDICGHEMCPSCSRSHRMTIAGDYNDGIRCHDDLAGMCYRMADQMLAQRAKGRQP